MKDGALRVALKGVARRLYLAELVLRRRRPLWRLQGSCGGCGRCCEAPGIRVGRLIWYFSVPRRLFLWWQRAVNGFVLMGKDRRGRAFLFRCTHYDAQARRCDSYASRPAMCRDYPRLLLDQPWPGLFDECGFRAVPVNAGGLARALDDAGISEEERRRLRERLRLD